MASSSPNTEERYIPVATDCDINTVSVTEEKETCTELVESAYISLPNNKAEGDFKSDEVTELATETVSGCKAHQPFENEERNPTSLSPNQEEGYILVVRDCEKNIVPVTEKKEKRNLTPSDESTICSSREEKDVPENENTAHNTINESTLLDKGEEQVSLGNESKAQNTLNESILTEGISGQFIVESENKANCKLLESARSDLTAEKCVQEKKILEGNDLCENSGESIDIHQSESKKACSMGCVFDKVNNTETGSKSRQCGEKSFQDICHFGNNQSSDRQRYCDNSEFISDKDSTSFIVPDHVEKTSDICKPKVLMGNPFVSVLPSVDKRPDAEEKKLFQENGAERIPCVPGRTRSIENHTSSVVSEYDANQPGVVHRSNDSAEYNTNPSDQNKDDHEKNLNAPNDKNNDTQFQGIDLMWRTNDDDLYEEANKKYEEAIEKYEYFWQADSPFSQWYYSEFNFDNNIKFTCAEQCMMYEKAALFGDCKNANKILKTENPRKMKWLGRQVHGFNDEIWNANCLEIVKKANIAKEESLPFQVNFGPVAGQEPAEITRLTNESSEDISAETTGDVSNQEFEIGDKIWALYKGYKYPATVINKSETTYRVEFEDKIKKTFTRNRLGDKITRLTEQSLREAEESNQ